MPAPWAIAVLLASECGLRSGEVRELRLGDIDMQAGVIHVTRSAAPDDAVRTQAGPTKSDADRRDVTIPATTLAPLSAHLGAHVRLGPDSLILSHADGRPVTSRTLSKAFADACAQANIDTPPPFHALRNLFLSCARL